MSREQRLARTFVELADTLVDDFDVVDLTVLLTERCVELLEASAAGLLLANGHGRLNLMAATSEATEVVELFQIQSDEGPCRDCFHSGAPVSVTDLREETDRWPRFAPVAIDAGFRAAHAVPLQLRSQVLGALSLFRAEPAMLERGDLDTARALADIATIGLIHNQAVREHLLVAEQLEFALNSRVAIEQAKGIIVKGASCGMDEAFARLRRFARSGQRPLTEVAQEVIDGTLRPEEIVSAAR